MSKSILLAAAIALVCAAALTAPAGAIIPIFVFRYTVPSGGSTTSTSCPSNDPCELKHAVEDVANAGDVVVVEPGAADYSLPTTITVSKHIVIQGQAGQPPPRLVATGIAFDVTTHEAGTHITRLRVESPVTAIRTTFVTSPSPGASVLEDLVVSQTDANAGGHQEAVASNLGWVLRDSVVSAADADGVAVSFGSATPTDMRNVTVSAPGAGATAVEVVGFPSPGCVPPPGPTVQNVIARGGLRDLSVIGCTRLDVSHSNFRPGHSLASAGGVIHDQGGNQSANPVFVNAAAGDFHQLPISPTIDAGTTDSLTGQKDFEGDPRTLGLAPDIGGDESQAPGVATGAATAVGAGGATLHGSVSGSGHPTSVFFKLGKTTAYGSTTPAQNGGSGNSALAVARHVGGLAPSTTYHYRIFATNSAGTRTGADRTFKTLAPGGGTPGNDKLTGTAGNNLICGLAGNDIVNALAGNDTVFGDRCNQNAKALFAAANGDGNDTLNGGDGNDKLTGSGGNDTLNGGKGDDTLNGGSGNDKLNGGSGNDKLNGGKGKNSYSGGAGNDKLNAVNGTKETVNCGAGKKDQATVDKKDKTKGCEKVVRAG